MRFSPTARLLLNKTCSNSWHKQIRTSHSTEVNTQQRASPCTRPSIEARPFSRQVKPLRVDKNQLNKLKSALLELKTQSFQSHCRSTQTSVLSQTQFVCFVKRTPGPKRTSIISTAGGSGDKFCVCAGAVSLWNNRNKQTWRRPSTVLWSCKFIVIYLKSTTTSLREIDAAAYFRRVSKQYIKLQTAPVFCIE